MPTPEKATLAAHAARWQAAAPLLDAQRVDDMRRADTAAAIASFARLYRDAIQHFPPEPTSGLVEQQRVFLSLRRA
jgi:hypothetical protein